MDEKGRPFAMLEEDEIDLIELYEILRKRVRFIFGVVFICTAISVVYSLVAPKTYRAEAVIMPFSSGTSTGTLLAALGNLGGALGGVAGIGASASPEQLQFMALLNSRTLAEKVIERFDLMKVLFEGEWDKKEGRWKDPKRPPLLEDGVKGLLSHMEFVATKKDPTIKISAEFRDPRLAADVVNGYIDGLREFVNSNAFTVAKKNRIFIEGQLAENKKELLEVGKELNAFYKENRVSDVESMVTVPIMDTDTTPPLDLYLGPQGSREAMWSSLEERKEELKKRLENIKVVKDVPQQVYLRYLMLRQELLGKLNTLLAQQYELAKIEEAREDLAFQVIDEARVPERKYKPKRRIIVGVAFAASIFLAVFGAFFLEFIQGAKERAKAMETSR